ncbi:MAG TPA: type II secretion system protein, partial [Lacipirellulaceae bacterium]|nr:type II secretion system protein [Lacipirellulaceae bacterium]
MTRRPAFTLIELVVVIMILGILAGVAAPKLFNTSATATENGARQTLAIVRDAIELYNAKYNALPPCAAAGAAADFKLAISEFMRAPLPACPVGTAKTNTIALGTGATTAADATPTHGWKYNKDNGTFII